MHNDANEVAPDPRKNKRARRQKKKGNMTQDVRTLSRQLTDAYMNGRMSYQDFTDQIADLKSTQTRMKNTIEKTRTLLMESKKGKSKFASTI